MPAFTISSAPRWTALLKRSRGWMGGDGIYSIRWLSGKDENSPQTLLWFSDSVIDTTKTAASSFSESQPGGSGAVMIHNTVAFLKGHRPIANQLDFFWRKAKSAGPAAVFSPAAEAGDKRKHPGVKNTDGSYYWLGAGCLLPTRSNGVQGSKISSRTKTQTWPARLHPGGRFVVQEDKEATDTTPILGIFAYRMRNTQRKVFGFEQTGNELLLVTRNMQIRKTIALPRLDSGSFGAAVYTAPTLPASHPDDDLYIYGIRGQHKSLIVARTKYRDFEDPATWRYFDGHTWEKDPKAAAGLANHLSNELSLSKMPDGRFVLIFQIDGISPYIGMKTAPTPYGPFSTTDTIWHCSEPRTGKDLFVYNAKAHPALSPENGLLISYNVNAFDFFHTLRKDPSFYRPRFLLLRWQQPARKQRIAPGPVK